MDIRQYVIDDLSYEDSWRLFKIIAEFVDGFDTLKKMLVLQYPYLALQGLNPRTQFMT